MSNSFFPLLSSKISTQNLNLTGASQVGKLSEGGGGLGDWERPGRWSGFWGGEQKAWVHAKQQMHKLHARHFKTQRFESSTSTTTLYFLLCLTFGQWYPYPPVSLASWLPPHCPMSVTHGRTNFACDTCQRATRLGKNQSKLKNSPNCHVYLDSSALTHCHKSKRACLSNGWKKRVFLIKKSPKRVVNQNKPVMYYFQSSNVLICGFCLVSFCCVEIVFALLEKHEFKIPSGSLFCKTITWKYN